MKRSLLLAVGLLIAFPLTLAAQRTQSAKKYVKQGIERFSRNDIVGAIAEYDRAISRAAIAEAVRLAGRSFSEKNSVRRAG